MAKFKRKSEMTLAELIEWGFKNNIKNKKFISNSKDYTSVTFDSTGWGEFNNYFSPEDTFTVEIEEEFTEETEIDNLVEFYFDRYGDLRFANHKNKTIRQRLDKYSFKPQAFYSLNEDATMTLIWKDGKLVD